MNREIKFRAWDNENKYMITSKQGIFTALRNSMNITVQDNGYYNNGDLLKPNKEKYTLMQYTGLKDKNGVEIYENDIIDIHQTVNGYNQFVIQYDNYKFSARYYNQKTKQILGWYQYDLDELFEINETEKEIEVIGNIYEDKEVSE